MTDTTDEKLNAILSRMEEIMNEISTLKDWMERISVDAQTVVFDECKIEKVIVNKPESPTEEQ